MPKSTEPQERTSLAEDYAGSNVKQKTPKRRKVSRSEGEDGKVIETKQSRRILQIGQELVDEDAAERQASQPSAAFEFNSRFVEEDEPGADAEEEDQNTFPDDDQAWGSDDEMVEEEIDPQDRDIFNKFNPADHDPSLDPNRLSFGGVENATGEDDKDGGTNLADLILRKIAMHEAAAGEADDVAVLEDVDRPPTPTKDDMEEEIELPPKVVEVYTTVAKLLSRHRSGPLPKPFKILPTLPAQQIPVLVALTRPEDWTPMALFLATRLFVSSKPVVAQGFLTSVLLPRVRDEIHETKKLNTHLYNALKKSLYKPAAFFKGILFPLLDGSDGGHCTLREAHIISSVVARVSVPALHSAAALLRLCDVAAEQFSTSQAGGGAAAGATNIFIRTLLEKKYALPFKVIDSLVFHFMRFKAVDPAAVGSVEDSEAMQTDAQTASAALAHKLPVLWHQSLLAFAQRYRNDITEDQREALLDLVQLRGHKDIGPEVRRELLAGRGRGIVATEDTSIGALASGADFAARMNIDGGDDTMVMAR